MNLSEKLDFINFNKKMFWRGKLLRKYVHINPPASYYLSYTWIKAKSTLDKLWTCDMQYTCLSVYLPKVWQAG